MKDAPLPPQFPIPVCEHLLFWPRDRDAQSRLISAVFSDEIFLGRCVDCGLLIKKKEPK
jgi:hypothetical protein